MKEERKPEYPEKTPDKELQKMPRTTVRTFKPHQDSNPHSSIDGRVGKKTHLPLHHVSPCIQSPSALESMEEKREDLLVSIIQWG